MEEKAGARISANAFKQSLLILFILMMLAGVLTRVLPAGEFSRVEEDGRQVIVPDSYQLVTSPNYPVWRWFTAPIETLGSDAGLNIIVILVVLFFAGGAFAVLDKTGTLKAFIALIVNRFSKQKFLLLWMVSLGFMLMGATLGTFEEVVILIPVMLALAYSLGWDALVGLGMSILATNMGFSAALTNPFTLGVSQKLAGLPAGSGLWFRAFVFVVVYLIFMWFLHSYAKKIDADPRRSLLAGSDEQEREKYRSAKVESLIVDKNQNNAIKFFGGFMLLILASMIFVPAIPALADYSLPIVGVLFLIGGLGAGSVSGAGGKKVWKGLSEGVVGLLPSIPLILMAASIRFIIDNGGVTDTLLNMAAEPFTKLGAYPASLVVYFVALILEFFIASGSAKAFLIIPIVMPLADLVGVTRQTAVLAYIFGDGFSNMAYPTNPVLLISLGLTVVSYPQWLKWTAKLWAMVFVVTAAFLWLATAIQLGPF